jgi:hypothetical protein
VTSSSARGCRSPGCPKTARRRWERFARGVDDGVVRGEVQYEVEGETWRHSFAMRVFAEEAELGAALAEAGLRLDQRLDARWFVAVAAP